MAPLEPPVDNATRSGKRIEPRHLKHYMGSMTALSRLTPAHRGYEFQDLLVACRFVDILLGTVVEARCDEKLFAEDRFDDLTTMDVDRRRERAQFKHTENDDRPLTLDTFTADRRGLRLDRLLYSMLADRDGPGSQATDTVFRVVLRDQLPTDASLTAVLAPLTLDPGPYLAAMRTTRLGFDAAALWQQNGGDADELRPFAFLFADDASLSYSDLEWCCDRLVLELGAPRASLDLTEPDAAEQLLLTRVRADVGAEAFPNSDRRTVDVAAAMVSAARAARQGLLVPSSEELLRRAQLRSDFGAVSRSHPVDPTVEVRRPSAVRQLVNAAGERAAKGGHLLVQGPPGHGKSWVCQQFLDALSDEGWLIAEHYCYLGDADGERLERVLIEAVFGSLIGRLAETDSRLVQDQRPRFAADEEALVACLRRSRDLEPDRRLALVIDGVDHITRVRSRIGASFDASRSMSEALASLDLPPGTVVIVLSQPGAHLDPLVEAGAAVTMLADLTENELRILASRLGLIPRDDGAADTDIPPPRIDDPEAVAAFLVALDQRSAGNALYATYLCRETLRYIDAHPDPAGVVLQLPPFDGTLENYYSYLYESLDEGAKWVADVIALLDFSVSRADLREIMPDAAHRVDDALEHLWPVLVERATQGGVRVYHESFARYLRSPYQQSSAALAALLGRITSWLEQKGLCVDSRAFHSLLPLLAEAGDDARVVNLVDGKFVTKAVAGGFPASAINRNLATAVGAAARVRQWPLVVRYVELSRAAESYQTERFDSTLLAFADVPAALLGADTMAARLLDEDRLVMSAREGLQMCAALDELGATAPWQPYMDGHLRESKSDNTSYGEASNRAVALAWLRGRLRMAAITTPVAPNAPTVVAVNAESDDDASDRDSRWTPHAPIDWSRVAQWVENRGLPANDVVRAVLDTDGWQGAMRLVDALKEPASACLAIADELAAQPDLDPNMSSPRQWAAAAVTHGTPRGALRRVLAHGVEPDDLATTDVAACREQLLDLTRRVQEPSVRSEEERIGVWLDACALAAHRDPIGLAAAEALIVGDGWYRCWLRFVVALSRAEAATSVDRERLALEALHMLTDDLRPFAGDPRSCDLYPLHPMIVETLKHAMGMLGDPQWREGLHVLKGVSDSITTTIQGELGGPIPPDLVLRLAVEGATPTRRDAAEQLSADEIAKGSGRRYYSDLAEYRLLAARLALASNDRAGAAAFWQEACVFLTAYGWRKDITIYEVLDPLPGLIEAAPALARQRVARAQALCERVPLHTDGKDTRHAWSRWWSLLAKADPVAAVHLAATELLRECNDPNRLLNEALEDVWREWHEHVDPVVAGSLRLTLDTPLDSADPKQLESVASNNGPAARRLLIWLLARADERPVSYSVTNSAELIARDDQWVAELNAIAEAAEVPCVGAIRDETLSKQDGDQWRDHRIGSMPPTMNSEATAVFAGFPPGMPGIAKAIRAWRTRPYDDNSVEWAPERFANIIGYRLIGLLGVGRSEEAGSALRSLADASGLGERTGILRPIAEGLERQGEVQLAALAYALTWTRARGRGGWLTFGGETEIGSLLRATALDAQVANAVVAEEIERIVASSRYGTYGISQAVIHALTMGALVTTDGSSIATAFGAWDEAFDVIASRAPRVDDSDDPDVPYDPPSPDAGEAAPGDLEGALALAVIAGLAHPGREKKRRAFLAVQLLLQERPVVCARVFSLALGAISDPGTLTWLLGVLESSDPPSGPVLEACQAVLRDLATHDHLTIRALSRRLITGEPPPLAPPAPPDNTLLEEPARGLWTPEQPKEEHEGDPPALDSLLDSVAGERIRRGKRELARLRDAVRARAVTVLDSDALQVRLRRQLDALGDRLNKRWPDAFLAHEQAIEDILQSVASGGRAARLMAGQLVADPVGWEDDLASALLDDPTVPLTLEAHRQPRPPLPPPPNARDEVWAQIRKQASGRSSCDVEAAAEQEVLLLATLTLASVTALPTVNGGPYRGWHWLGTYEKRMTKPRDWRREKDLTAKRYRVLEVRDVNDRRALTLPPVAAGDLRLWRAEIDPATNMPALGSSQPLIGIDTELRMVGDGRVGLGVPESLLVPTASLIALLRLLPGKPWTYRADSEPGLALVTWRAEYDVSDYYLAWPRSCGCGIVIRRDLLAALVAIAGEKRLILRDFVVGDSELASPDAEGPSASVDTEPGAQ